MFYRWNIFNAELFPFLYIDQLKIGMPRVTYCSQHVSAEIETYP